MEIEVGEYIRTNKDVEILRITEVRKENKCITDKYPYVILQLNRDFTKHSKNIIDLLEVGDIVKTGVETIFIIAFEDKENLEYFKELYKNDQDTILSILTKEQYEQNSYKL